MNRIILLLLALLSSFSAAAQLTGVIVNQETGVSLSFATVFFESTSKGSISNEDGFFRLNCPASFPDTLQIAFIGFEAKRIPMFECTSEPMIIQLEPAFVEVPIVVISVEKGTAPKREMKILKKWQDARGNWESKIYLSLTSEEDSIPVEAVEACFNGSFYGNNILDLALKGGRLGVHSDPNYRFVNLNTSDVLLKFSLKPEVNSPIPHPAVQREKAWKAKYVWDLIAQTIERGDTLRRWVLHPKFSELSSCEIVFNINKNQVRSYAIRTQNTLPRLIKPVVDSDEISSLDLRMEWQFSPVDQRIELLNFQYLMGYKNNLRKRELNVSGILHAYDQEELFPEVLYSGARMTSDYERLLVWSFDPKFWSQQDIVPTSKKSEAHQAFFKSHGHLTNIAQLGALEFPVFRCEPGEINWNHLKGAKKVYPSKLNDSYYGSRVSNAGKYALTCDWFVNPWYDGDTCRVEQAIIFDGRNSWYELENDSLALEFVNTYVSLVQVEQANLVKRIQAQNIACQEKKLKPVWSDARAKSNMRIKRFLREVDRGENTGAFLKWQAMIRAERKSLNLQG
ncbi:MAG: hypothetical protein ACJAU0_000911 [Flavobacteriales bacterium]|jgi:hypothetical protein